MRPRGEVRAAISDALGELKQSTWRGLVPHVPLVNPDSPAEVRLVGYTLRNMVRAGEVVRCGRDKPAGARVWAGMYELAGPDAPPPPPAPPPTLAASLDALAEVAQSWADFD